MSEAVMFGKDIVRWMMLRRCVDGELYGTRQQAYHGAKLSPRHTGTDNSRQKTADKMVRHVDPRVVAFMSKNAVYDMLRYRSFVSNRKRHDAIGQFDLRIKFHHVGLRSRTIPVC